jgi:hypothetical protein
MKTLREITNPNLNKDEDIYSTDELLRNSHHYGGNDHDILKRYTGSLSKYVNTDLWNAHKKETDPKLGRFSSEIGQLDKAISAKKAPRNITVYSGVKVDPRKMMNKNKVVHLPGYTSTSYGKHIAEGFGYDDEQKSGNPDVHIHVIRTVIPEGHSAAGIEHISLNTGEHEIVLPRGLYMKHIKTVRHVKTVKGFPIDNIPDRKEYTHIHHMKIVPDDYDDKQSSFKFQNPKKSKLIK